MAKLNFASKEKRQYCASLGINENDLQFIAPPAAHRPLVCLPPNPQKRQGEGGGVVFPTMYFLAFLFVCHFSLLPAALSDVAAKSKGPKTFSITVMRSGNSTAGPVEGAGGGGVGGVALK